MNKRERKRNFESYEKRKSFNSIENDREGVGPIVAVFLDLIHSIV